jgi:hypothetical protein
MKYYKGAIYRGESMYFGASNGVIVERMGIGTDDNMSHEKVHNGASIVEYKAKYPLEEITKTEYLSLKYKSIKL